MSPRRQDPRPCGSRRRRTWARICRRSRRRCRPSSTARCSTACTRSGRSTCEVTGRLQQHHRGRRVSRRRAAGSLLRAGADGGSGRGRAQDGRGRAAAEELHPEVLRRVPDARGGGVRQRRLRSRLRQVPADRGLQEVPRRAGGGPQAGPAARHRVLDLHRGVLDRAVQAGGRARRRRRALRVGQGPGASDRRGDRVHRLALARSGPRDDVLAAGGRRARHSDGAGGDRPRRHRADSVRHGHLRQPLRLGRRHRDLHVAQQDQGKGQEDRGPSAGGLAGRHRVRQRPVPGQGRAGQGRAVRRRRADRLRAAQLSGGPRARPRGDVVLRSVELLLPLRRSRLRGRDRPGHRQGHDRALRGGGRRRQHHEPDDRGRHGARWRRPGHRTGALRGRDVRRQLGPADDGHA